MRAAAASHPLTGGTDVAAALQKNCEYVMRKGTLPSPGVRMCHSTRRHICETIAC